MEQQHQRPRIYTASVRGNSHVLRDIANQDSSYFQYGSTPDRWAAAIADGHGSSAHPKSEIGSRVAVQSAVETALDFLENEEGEFQSLEEIGERIINSIINKWRVQISTLNQIEKGEQTKLDEGDEITPDDLLLYGTTLAFVFPYRDVLLLGSIGDSDGFWRLQSGLVRSLDLFGNNDDGIGEETHSLCLPNAKRFFRFKALPSINGGTLLVATDGVKKSLSDDDSLNNILDYYHTLASNKNDSLEADLTEQLQELTKEGSGDDCTAIIIHFPIAEVDNELQSTHHESSDDLEVDNSAAIFSEQVDGNSLQAQEKKSKLTIKKKDSNFLLTLISVGAVVALVALGKFLYPRIPTEQMTSYWEEAKLSVPTIKAQVSKKFQCLQK
jgi:hypothetical protein